MKLASTKKTMLSVACACVLAACMGLAACGGSSSGTAASGSLNDGSYEGTSSVLDANVDGDGYVVVSLKVEGGVIADAQYQAFEPDGTPKDANYGKDGQYYAVAQKVISTGDDYLAQFLDTGDPNAIDTVSGATYLHDQFVEAAQNAIDEASK